MRRASTATTTRASARALTSVSVGLRTQCGIESEWGVLKRSIHGTWHHVSSKHLRRDVDDAPNAKGNVRFEREIVQWRDRPLIDLRRKR